MKKKQTFLDDTITVRDLLLIAGIVSVEVLLFNFVWMLV